MLYFEIVEKKPLELEFFSLLFELLQKSFLGKTVRMENRSVFASGWGDRRGGLQRDNMKEVWGVIKRSVS